MDYYKYSDSKVDRRETLEDLMSNHSIPVLIRELNMMKNVNSNAKARDRLTSDVNFLKKMYEKKSQNGGINDANVRIFEIGGTKSKIHSIRDKVLQMQRTCGCDGSRDFKSMMGGADDNDSSDDTIIESIDLPQKICKTSTSAYVYENDNGKIKNRVYEEHTVGDKKVIFFTITKNNIKQILELDRKYLNVDETEDDVRSKIEKNEMEGNLIGIEADGILQGYCQTKRIGGSGVMIVWFCANKSFKTPLYTFLEKYLKVSGYELVYVSNKKTWNDEMIKFWDKMGFVKNDDDTWMKKIDK